MEGTARGLAHASVQTHGKGITVNMVGHHFMYSTFSKLTSTISVAVCEDEFCLNGGTCLHPGVNCSCPANWMGVRCSKQLIQILVLDEGPVIIVSSTAGACMLVLTVALTLVSCVAVHQCRKRRSMLANMR